MSDEKKPVFEQRLGAIRVTVWENKDKEGGVFYNSTIVRRYKSGDDEWSNSNSYTGLADLALLKEAVELARRWVTSRTLSKVAECES